MTLRLLLITDRQRMGGVVDAVARALVGAPPGVVGVMLREKDLSARALLELGEALLGVTRPRGVPLIVNDRVDVARLLGAEGVHLPVAGLSVADARALLGPEVLVGASTHDRDELAAAAGADYVTFGPVWETPSKAGLLSPRGPEGLRALPDGPPVFALGGVDPDRTPAALAAGATGVACIRPVWGAADPADTVAAFLRAFEV